MLDAITVELLEAAITKLSKADQVMWMRFLMGVPLRPTTYHPLNDEKMTTRIIWEHLQDHNHYFTNVDIELWHSAPYGRWNVMVGPWDFNDEGHLAEAGWYNSRSVDTLNGVARAVIRGIRKYFKAMH